MKPLVVSEEDQSKRRLLARRPKTDQRTAQRARIVLECAAGKSNQAVAARLGLTPQTVGTWRERFRTGGLGALGDLPRSGQPRKITDAKVEEVITRSLEKRPQNAPHWSTRTMAEASGLNQNAIVRIWRAFGLKPHWQENFKLSTDPFFVESRAKRDSRSNFPPNKSGNVRDIVGLYLNPPEQTRAVVLGVEEKSQVQARDRRQPVLPMRPGQAERCTPDSYRHGTTSRFAALDLATGKVIGRCQARHRQQEFVRFLDQIEANVPAGLDLHLVLDNYATHKTSKVAAWLKRRPRYHLHFTPTGSSWLNQIERWFAKITEQRIRRGVFRRVDELVAAIDDYIAKHHQTPKPFVWTASADLILGRVERLCKRTNRSPH